MLIILEQISYNNDPNSSAKNYYISKNKFIETINQTEVKDAYVNIKYVAKNTKEFGKRDIEIKNKIAQKIADAAALWIGIKTNKPVINNYPNKSKPQQIYNANFVDLIIDYAQI